MGSKFEEMLSELADERAQVFTELEKLDKAIDAMEHLVSAQQQRGSQVSSSLNGKDAAAYS